MSYGCIFKSKRYLDSIYPIKKISFENILLNAPCNYDKYLKSLYNNWKCIPNKIETHNVKIIFKPIK